MEPQQFVAEFGHIANAPEGVARLREMILQFAKTRPLVARAPGETTVEHTLLEADKLRQDYESRLDIRSRNRSEIPEDRALLIPDHWRWATLDRVGLYIQRGKGPSYATHGKVSTVSQKCVQWSGFDSSLARPISDESLTAYGEERYLCPGDVLLNSTGTGTVGRSVIVPALPDSRLVADSHVTVIRLACVEPKYIWCILASPWIQARIHPTHPRTLVSGTTQQVELANSTVRALSIPLPPVEEQARIVAKVDELMALCDKLEAQQQARESRKAVLAQALLTRFAEEPTQANLHSLFHFSRAITPADLRKAVLALAVQGKLVPQDPNEDSADTLLTQVREDLHTLKRSTKIRPLQTTVAARPHELPTSWRWSYVQELAQPGESVTYGILKPVWVESGIPTVRVTEMKTGTINLGALPKCDPKRAALFSKTRLNEGDLLISKDGTIGKTAFVPKGLAGGNITQHMLRFAINKRMNRDFVRLCIDSPLCQAWMIGEVKGIALQGVNVGDFRRMPIPIPPLAEQDRIVVRANELMAIIGRLESQISAANTVGKRLAESVTAALTGITTREPQDLTVKAPPTELIATLRLGTLPDRHQQAPLATELARHQGTMAVRDLWQRFGGDIDVFYAQLKTEVTKGWIQEPSGAEVRLKAPATADA